MLAWMVANKKRIVVVVMLSSLLYGLLSLLATGQTGPSIFVFFLSLILTGWGIAMTCLVGYPVIWIQYKNPACPPGVYLGFCTLFTALLGLVAVIMLLMETMAAWRGQAAAMVFAEPAFVLGAGLAMQLVRKSFQHRLQSEHMNSAAAGAQSRLGSE
ncbi:MAG: hypothetical protein R3292_07555 [Alcanivorax sp.]|nr:hypothetical protein [Alcanivorax sp.]